MERAGKPNPKEAFLQRQSYLPLAPSTRKILKHSCPLVPKEEQFERYYYRMKEHKAWLKDVRNQASYKAIEAHLHYCQADFREMIALKSLDASLLRTGGWNPLELTVEFYYHPLPPPPLPKEPASRPRSRNINSRHPRNVKKNGQWRSQIYEEMVRLGRSLQGTYQHLEQGKIARQERQMMNPPEQFQD